MHSPCNRPRSSNRFIKGTKPPILTNSAITNFPLGFRSANTGTRCPIFWISSISNFTPAAHAIAKKCNTAFVDPPNAVITTMAFSIAFLVKISLGQIPFNANAIAALPASLASNFLLGETAAIAELLGKLNPIASIAHAIVFAVYIPPHDPGPGIAHFSISPNCSSVIEPFALCPTASNTLTISKSFFPKHPGKIVPP